MRHYVSLTPILLTISLTFDHISPTRCAILWGEMWHEALEQAYRRYFYYEQHGIDAMLGVLPPLYRMP